MCGMNLRGKGVYGKIGSNGLERESGARWCSPHPPGEVAGVAVNSRRARLRERHWFSEKRIGRVGGG